MSGGLVVERTDSEDLEIYTQTDCFPPPAKTCVPGGLVCHRLQLLLLM